ncbi:TPA: hypothetical protein ACGO9Z_001992 [Streptococcus suis]|uniref:Uncharacterized protein n=2 Tax=Streptococcus TaxID=1301 RepID=A0A3R8SBA4_STRSU|nr:hypothetical protein [Streptococcus suis]MDW8742228.1 hypothetical protein [Streptococcus suis]NQG19330.1 hypothetical protein [Streptococcus suis]NQH32868.1 hypothetical protein [Streptococcus suis]NQH96044.1 hypothetical protein [Streptococcus suis]NQI34193.1 hypothetical protein [Streptococcus suis]
MSNRKEQEELKYLESKKVLLEAQLENLRDRKGQVGKEISLVSSKLNSVNQRIQALKGRSDLIVSEHAMLRYLERVEQLDVAILNRIIAEDEELQSVVKTLGNGIFPVKGRGFKLVIKDNVVETITLDD